MPTGVTVSRSGRTFVTFPRWGDPVRATLVELRNGAEVPYPNLAMNELDKSKAAENLINVQSAVVDPKDRLWAVDTGSVNMGYTMPNGPKLVCFDLATNLVVKKINLPSNVALPTTYLNDVRFDMKRGSDGYAFITDSSDKGPNAIIVVDLASGNSWRRLNNHPSTKADLSYEPKAEGRPLLIRPKFGQAQKPKIGADGIAISLAGDRLYYCPLIGNKLYSVSVEALANRDTFENEVAATVKDEGTKPASDGLETDPQGRILVTDYENSRVLRKRLSDGRFEPILQMDRRYWPDTLSVGPNGDLYVLANQLHRQARFNQGKDLRLKPYVLIRSALPK